MILISIIAANSYAQDFKLGLRLESNSALVNENHKNTAELNWPAGWAVGLLYNMNNHFGIETRVGGDGGIYTFGAEFDLLLRHNFSESYYIIVGGMIRLVGFDKGYLNHGHGPEYFVSDSDEYWPAIGAGYNYNKKFSFELMAVHTNNLQLGWTQNWWPNDRPLYINWLLKLGACYTIDL